MKHPQHTSVPALFSLGSASLLLLAATPLPLFSQNAAGSPSRSSATPANVSVRHHSGQTEVTLNGRVIYTGPVTGPISTRTSSINGVEHTFVTAGDKVLWENQAGSGPAPAPGQPTPGAPSLPTFPEFQKLIDEHQRQFERQQEEQRRFLEQAAPALPRHPKDPAITPPSGGSSSGSSGGMSGGSSGGMSGGSSGGHSSGSFSNRRTESKETRPGLAPRTAPGGAVDRQSATAAIQVRTIQGSTVIVYQGKEYPVGPTQGPITSRACSVNGDTYAAAFEGDRVIWENTPGAAQNCR